MRKGGYWADFINPFSGRPYLYPTSTSGDKLYEADEKFRCLDFEIFDIQHCKIVSNEQNSINRRFMGRFYAEMKFVTFFRLQEACSQMPHLKRSI